MYLGYEQVVADSSVKNAAALNPPGKATYAELQADTQDVRYTMDNATDPSSTTGMVLATTHDPKQFQIDDVKRIRFTRGAGSDGNLNLHYFSGRDI